MPKVKFEGTFEEIVMFSRQLGAAETAELNAVPFDPTLPVDPPTQEPQQVVNAQGPAKTVQRRTRKSTETTAPVSAAEGTLPVPSPAAAESGVSASDTQASTPPAPTAPPAAGSDKPKHTEAEAREMLMKYKEAADGAGKDGMAEAAALLARFELKMVRDMKAEHFDRVYNAASEGVDELVKL